MEEFEKSSVWDFLRFNEDFRYDEFKKIALKHATKEN